MLRLTKIPLLGGASRLTVHPFRKAANGPNEQQVYSKRQIESINDALLSADHFLYPTKIPSLRQGLPTITKLRAMYPDAKTPEPSIYDKIEQASYEKLQTMTYTQNRGYAREIQLEKQGRTFEFPIDSSKYNWFDDKIPAAEDGVDFSEHIDFVEKQLKQFRFQGKPGKSNPSNQLYFFLEAVGIGLSKNPYMTLEEKLDEVARYIQYFVFKKEVLLGVDLLTEEQMTAYETSDFAKRHIKKDHWTKEGYTPRYSWRHHRATPHDKERPEYFWLNVPSAKDREKLKEFFGEHYNEESKKMPRDSAETCTPLNIVKIANFLGENKAGQIGWETAKQNKSQFDLSKINYTQVQVEDDHVREKSRSARVFYFEKDAEGNSKAYRNIVSKDGKVTKVDVSKSNLVKGSGRTVGKVGSMKEFLDVWYRTKHKRKMRAKRARLRKN